MINKFGTKLMLILGTFGLLMTFIISFVDQTKIEKNVRDHKLEQRDLVEITVLNEMKNIDTGFSLFNQDVETRMKDYSEYVLQKYKENPNFDEWNFNELKNRFEGMDIYVINNDYVVTHSSFKTDIGLDFKQWPDFSSYLASILKNGNFVADNMDQETNTGNLRKYSYQPTPDGKYILELGMVLKDSPILEKYNFSKSYNLLEEKFDSIDEITVYNESGNRLGITNEKEEHVSFHKTRKEKELHKTFEQVVKTNTSKDVKIGKNIYTYIPYSIEGEGEKYASNRVLEIVFNENELQQILSENKKTFYTQVLLIMILVLCISYIISKILSRPMYLAFHDVLTGLVNRAHFEQVLEEKVKKGKRGEKTALMVIDLDNFKTVNDTLGHDRGDFLLKDVARRLKSCLRNNEDVAARLGGDEFTIILSDIKDENHAKDIAERILEELKRPLELTSKDLTSELTKGADITNRLNVSASIGIAITPDHANDAESLYKKADIALYHAKSSGKGTYKIYKD